MKRIWNISGILFLASIGAPANILFLETTMSSEQHAWTMNIIKGLAKEGHNITSLTLFEDKENGIHNLHLRETKKILSDGSQKINILKLVEINVWMKVMLDYEFHVDFCRNLVKDSSFKFLFSYPDDFKFDLIVYDSLSNPCLLEFHEKFNESSLIRIQSNFQDSLLQDLDPSMSYENIKFEDLSFKERVLNFLFRIFRKSFYDRLLQKCEDTLQEYSPQVNLKSSLKAQKLVLRNSHVAFEIWNTEAPNNINVGNLHIKKRKNSSDLKLLRARNGIILFSLGTDIKVKNLGQNKLDEILETFSKLSSYTIIWLSNSEDELDDFDFPENVLAVDDSQGQLFLGHEKIKLFISTGEIFSVQESLWFGVPHLGIPVFSHQKININKLTKLGLAEKYDLLKVQSETFYEAIKKILEDSNYSKKMSIYSKAVRDQTEHPLDKALWWINWVLRHPDINFKDAPEDSKLCLLQKESVDVIAFLTIATLIPLYIIIRFISFAAFICYSNQPIRKIKRRR